MTQINNAVNEKMSRMNTDSSAIKGDSKRILGTTLGLPSWLSGKEFACNAGDMDLFPGSGRSPGEGNGNSLQHSCLGSPRDRGARQATVHRVAQNWTRLTN